MGGQIDTSSSETTSAQSDQEDRLVIRGLWCYILKSRKARPSASESKRLQTVHIETVEKRGYKVGIKIKQDQTVERLSFQGMRGEFALVINPSVTQELDQAFGADPGDKWVGLVPPPDTRRRPTFPEPLLVCYKYALTIRPVRKMPQVVPVVLTYRDESFQKHYLLDVRILATQPKGIKTRVKAVL